MSTQARTDAVSPHELARKRGQIIGEIAIAAFPRLRTLVLGDGVVSVALNFTRDDKGRCLVEGPVAVSVELECQRCLEPVRRSVELLVSLCLVGSDTQAGEFNDAGELVNFISDDRGALQKDGSLRMLRWSTPMREYREFEGRRVATRGEAIFHYPEGDFVYGRFVLKHIRFDIQA